MRSEMFGAAIFVCAAVLGVKYLEGREPASLQSAPVAASLAPPPAKPFVSSSLDEEVRIPVGEHHQFFVTAAVNRRPFAFLVDTGASYVALRESDARNAFVKFGYNDFTQPVRTANGETKAALVEIDDIEIDGIRIENVKAFILPDEQLGMNLLGMSFLSRLRSVETRAGEMILRG